MSVRDDENELPDAVVRMFRESLDEDGLDFLRRGPRTGAERLAFAQPVHPEAYQAAQRAPVPAREDFSRRGVLDRERHFIGPDGNLYVRDEAMAEPLHASIRRGFETAVPGYKPQTLGDALAQGEMPGSDEPPMARSVGWHPAHQAGPLRAKEIEIWSRHATPNDAANLDPRLRKDVLHRLWWESDRGHLTDAEHALGQDVYAGIKWDRAVRPPHSAEMEVEYLKRVFNDPMIVNAEKDWIHLSAEERRDALERVVRHLSDVSGFPMPEVADGAVPGAEGVYSGDKNQITLSDTPFVRNGLGSIPKAAHEATHALQRYLGQQWASGALSADDENYEAGEWAALTDPFKLVPSDRGTGPYVEQLREAWADWLAKMVRQGFYDRQGGTKP